MKATYQIINQSQRPSFWMDHLIYPKNLELSILFYLFAFFGGSSNDILGFLRTVHFEEMREVLNDKKDLKNVILERVNEQIAAEVIEACG